MLRGGRQNGRTVFKAKSVERRDIVSQVTFGHQEAGRQRYMAEEEEEEAAKREAAALLYGSIRPDRMNERRQFGDVSRGQDLPGTARRPAARRWSPLQPLNRAD
jgi:hypothetical protein